MAYEIAKDALKGMPVKRMKSAKTSELAKLLCTSYYGVCISWHREMKKMCDKFGVDFDEAVTELNKTYNKGYKKFRPNVIRPVLTPPEGNIGGHCICENSRLLSKQYKSEFLNLIK
jgi:UDP-N-acetyl-D-mannosaminuronate dehydrogenase